MEKMLEQKMPGARSVVVRIRWSAKRWAENQTLVSNIRFGPSVSVDFFIRNSVGTAIFCTKSWSTERRGMLESEALMRKLTEAWSG